MRLRLVTHLSQPRHAFVTAIICHPAPICVPLPQKSLCEQSSPKRVPDACFSAMGNFFARCNFSGDELRLTNANHK